MEADTTAKKVGADTQNVLPQIPDPSPEVKSPGSQTLTSTLIVNSTYLRCILV